MPKNKLPLTIAIVDDDESILDSLKIVLENQEWNTHTYISGDAFLADFEVRRPDCIILDTHFPGTSGVEVMRSINKGIHGENSKEGCKKSNAIPTIVLTAYPKSQETAEIIRLGANEVLAKPITAEVLIDHVQIMLAS